jgi:hypothetical protein
MKKNNPILDKIYTFLFPLEFQQKESINDISGDMSEFNLVVKWYCNDLNYENFQEKFKSILSESYPTVTKKYSENEIKKDKEQLIKRIDEAFNTSTILLTEKLQPEAYDYINVVGQENDSCQRSDFQSYIKSSVSYFFTDIVLGKDKSNWENERNSGKMQLSWTADYQTLIGLFSVLEELNFIEFENCNTLTDKMNLLMETFNLVEKVKIKTVLNKLSYSSRTAYNKRLIKDLEIVMNKINPSQENKK